MVTGYIDVSGIEHLLEELEEMMEVDLHLSDPVTVAEQLLKIDQVYPELSDDDKIFVTLAVQAFEQQIEWEDGTSDKDYYDSLAFTQQYSWKWSEEEGDFKKYEMRHQGLITPDEFREEYGEVDEWSENL